MGASLAAFDTNGRRFHRCSVVTICRIMGQLSLRFFYAISLYYQNKSVFLEDVQWLLYQQMVRCSVVTLSADGKMFSGYSINPLNTEFFSLEISFSLNMPLTHRISICVKALTPKLSPTPLPALASRHVTLTRPPH